MTLHVGLGTFKPVKVDRVEEHRMDLERAEIPADTAERVNRAKREGRRVVAVGTTSVRTLEASARAHGGAVAAGAFETDLFLVPGATFHVVDALLTNFHLPRSTLLMLVAAFAGRESVLAAYAEAARGYRFLAMATQCSFADTGRPRGCTHGAAALHYWKSMVRPGAGRPGEAVMKSTHPSVELADRQGRFTEMRRRATEGPSAGPAQAEGPWITLSRELGSGGGELAAQLGAALGWRIYDREILQAVAADTRRDQWTLERFDEKGVRTFGELVTPFILPTDPGQSRLPR